MKLESTWVVYSDIEGEPMESDHKPENHVVVAAFYEDERVAGAVRKLKQMGFRGAQIGIAEDISELGSVVGPQKGNYFISGALSGGMTGGFVGGMFGLLMGVGLLRMLSWAVMQDIGAGIAIGALAGLALGGLVGCLAALRMGSESQPEPGNSVVMVSVDAGSRNEEAKSALIESGGDLSPTNALDLRLM